MLERISFFTGEFEGFKSQTPERNGSEIPSLQEARRLARENMIRKENTGISPVERKYGERFSGNYLDTHLKTEAQFPGNRKPNTKPDMLEIYSINGKTSIEKVEVAARIWVTDTAEDCQEDLAERKPRVRRFSLIRDGEWYVQDGKEFTKYYAPNTIFWEDLGNPFKIRGTNHVAELKNALHSKSHLNELTEYNLPDHEG